MLHLPTSRLTNSAREELADRFGPIPAAVEQLLELARLRIWAHGWKINSIHIEDPYIVLGYTDRQRLENLVRRESGQLRVADGQSAYLPLGKGVSDIQVVLSRLKSLLRQDSPGH